MGGLARVLKLYGKVVARGADGKSVTWLWDYANDKARLQSDMSKEEIMASEKAKWENIKESIENNNL